ncbi:SGNH/GDSL hydrolase family protein [Haloechinothrix sp. LS1_15]|nr:SGNH/GDSL hydrolase family protein [Haloechinothrix sp. LS1_15]
MALVPMLLTGLLVGVGEAARAEEDSYVALGDSYASGVGTRSYHERECYRSPLGYPALVGEELGARLDLRACSGARVADVLDSQLDGMGAATDYVTVTVGGNDAGFAEVLTACARPWPYTCAEEIAEARAVITGALPAKLDMLYRAIAERAPQATVVAVGYPRLFNGQVCNLVAQITPEQQAELNATADLLAQVIANRAAAHGFAFADPREAFNGHAVCDSDEWINGLSYPILESYHPNQRGYALGYAPLVTASLAAGVPGAS